MTFFKSLFGRENDEEKQVREAIHRFLNIIAVVAFFELEIGSQAIEESEMVIQTEPGTRVLKLEGKEHVGGMTVPLSFDVFLDERIFLQFGDRSSMIMVFGLRKERPQTFVYWVDTMVEVYRRGEGVRADFRPQLLINQN